MGGLRRKPRVETVTFHNKDVEDWSQSGIKPSRPLEGGGRWSLLEVEEQLQDAASSLRKTLHRGRNPYRNHGFRKDFTSADALANAVSRDLRRDGNASARIVNPLQLTLVGSRASVNFSVLLVPRNPQKQGAIICSHIMWILTSI